MIKKIIVAKIEIPDPKEATAFQPA